MTGLLALAVSVVACSGASAPDPTPTVAPTETPAPSPSPTPEAIEPEAAFTITAPADGATVATPATTVTGTGPAGARVVQDISMAPDKEAVVDASGTWSVDVRLEPGVNTFKFRLGDDKATVTTVTVTYMPAAAATPETTAAPEGTPGPTTDPLDDLGQVIPGLAVVDVTLNLEPRGFTCDGPDSGVDVLIWHCQKDTSTSSVVVEVYAETPGIVRSVDSTVLWYGSGSGDETFDAFLGYIATLRYEGSTPKKAKAWVTSRAKGSTHFGPADYELATASTKRARFLTIKGNGR